MARIAQRANVILMDGMDNDDAGESSVDGQLAAHLFPVVLVCGVGIGRNSNSGGGGGRVEREGVDSMGACGGGEWVRLGSGGGRWGAWVRESTVWGWCAWPGHLHRSTSRWSAFFSFFSSFFPSLAFVWLPSPLLYAFCIAYSARHHCTRTEYRKPTPPSLALAHRCSPPTCLSLALPPTI